MSIDKEVVKVAAVGRWPDILAQLGGLTQTQLTKKQQPCPNCGGDDRYCFDDKFGNGDWFCRGCGAHNHQGPGTSDGFGMLMRLHDWTFEQALSEVARFLHLDETNPLTPEELQRLRQEAAARQKGREEADRQADIEKTRRAQAAWDAAVPLNEADPALVEACYWTHKGLKPIADIRIERDGEHRLLIPISAEDGSLQALQCINADPGEKNGWRKRDLGPKKGGSWLIGNPIGAKVIAIAEGPATGYSIHEATTWPTIVAFGTGNLEAAVKRAKHVAPTATLVFCADNDEDGTGLKAAEPLAQQYGAVLAMPPTVGHDFNDYHQAEGPQAVTDFLTAALEAGTGPAPASSDDDVTPEEAALFAQLRQLAEVEDIGKRSLRLAKLAQVNSVSIKTLMQVMESVLDPESAAEEGRRIFEVMDDDELFAPCDDDPLLLHYVIPGLVPVGEAVLLAGEAKAGKSLLLYEAIHAVLTGGEFLGEPCRKGKVLLIQLEENNSLKMRLAAKQITTPENKGRFRVIRNFDATNPKALDQLRRELASFKPDLVCLDSLRGAMTYSEESENLQGFTRPIKRVIKACQNANVALLAIHHTNKNQEAKGLDRIAGNKALVGEFWGVLQLEKMSEREEDPDRALAVTPRDGQRLRMHIRCNVPPGEPFHWEHLGNIAGDLTSPDLRHKLLTLLQQAAGEMRTGEICLRLPGEEKETVRRALYRLRDLGLVRCRTGQSDGIGRPPTLWSINAEHFERGVTVTTPDGSRNVFAKEGTPPLPPYYFQPSVSQNPSEKRGVLGLVTKPAQNSEALEAPLEEEEMGFVTREAQNKDRGGGGSSENPEASSQALDPVLPDLQLVEDPAVNNTVLRVLHRCEADTDFAVMEQLVAEGVEADTAKVLEWRMRWDQWREQEGAA